ncbi:MAG: glycosyltransferase family 4 protein [Gammaproteobacteria bacterium]|nr:glycosyltransferase family 4 protein [Gammaproteobacteria bacterium]
MNKIKLLIIAPTFYPVHGGAGLRFYRYLPFLYENNIEVTVVCGTPKLKKFTREDHQADWVHAVDGELISELEISNAKILKYKIHGESAKKRSEILLNKAIERSEDQNTKPDVVHIIAPMPFKVLSQLGKLRAMGVKLVYSHTIAKKYSENILLEKIQKWKVRKINQHYHSIIVQSASMKETLLKDNSKANIRIILNGVDTDKFCPLENEQDKQNLRNKLGLPIDAKLITLVGAVHPRKGTDLLVEAWSVLVRKFQDMHLIIIGPRYDQSRKELKQFKDAMEQMIKSSASESNIHFLGQVDNVNEYLQISDLFVFPSKREGMPNAVLEAMSTGVAVILTPFIGLSKEMGDEGSEYLLSQRSSNEIAKNICYVLENNELQTNLARCARNWVVDYMGLASTIRSHADLYRHLLT